MDEKVNVLPFSYAMSLTGGKGKMNILFWLWKSIQCRQQD